MASASSEEGSMPKGKLTRSRKGRRAGGRPRNRPSAFCAKGDTKDEVVQAVTGLASLQKRATVRIEKRTASCRRAEVPSEQGRAVAEDEGVDASDSTRRLMFRVSVQTLLRSSSMRVKTVSDPSVATRGLGSGSRPHHVRGLGRSRSAIGALVLAASLALAAFGVTLAGQPSAHAGSAGANLLPDVIVRR